ncbi:GTP-binding protein Obg CgtA [Pisolithus microcarpus]|nr:GTP-binding protein Obg CgtA [Pisolithus microcarpus]
MCSTLTLFTFGQRALAVSPPSPSCWQYHRSAFVRASWKSVSSTATRKQDGVRVSEREALDHDTSGDVHTRTTDTHGTSNSTLADLETARRNRKSEWKRRQGGQTFLDHSIVTEKVGTAASPSTAKNSNPSDLRQAGTEDAVRTYTFSPLLDLPLCPPYRGACTGCPGDSGQGTWQHGRNAEPTVIRVPVGTVVKELGYDDPRRAPDEWEAEDEAFQELNDEEQRKAAWRERRWRDTFQQAERAVWREERERRWMRRRRYLDPLWQNASERDVDAPLGLGKKEFLGHMVARGGAGGLGNPNFVSQTSRSPKFATKGQEGERITLSLELKILADVGLVGMPNAGKSTQEVASYAFTTLNPVVGVIRVADDGTFEGELRGLKVFDETAIEEERELERQDGRTQRASSPDSELVIDYDIADQHPGYPFDILESFRFTISDNPGLIAGASSNVGLGHSFLRSLERSHALVYVVDLAGEAPWDELRALRDELEAYLPGMSDKARLVVANKADLLVPEVGEGNHDKEEAVEKAKAKLKRLEEFVKMEMEIFERGETTGDVGVEECRGRRTMDVVPVSAKYGQNLKRVVLAMKGYVEEARRGS